jgi:hypothetical protein
LPCVYDGVSTADGRRYMKQLSLLYCTS